MCGFCAGQDLDDQPSSSYRFLAGDASADMLANTEDLISLSSYGMWSKKVSELSPIWLGVAPDIICSRERCFTHTLP